LLLEESNVVRKFTNKVGKKDDKGGSRDSNYIPSSFRRFERTIYRKKKKRREGRGLETYQGREGKVSKGSTLLCRQASGPRTRPYNTKIIRRKKNGVGRRTRRRPNVMGSGGGDRRERPHKNWCYLLKTIRICRKHGEDWGMFIFLDAKKDMEG